MLYNRCMEVNGSMDWQKQIQIIIDEIDLCIKRHESEDLALGALAGKLGYSPSHFSRKFREISGMQLRDYLRSRKLAFALKELRDSDRSILDIALDYGFSSHEAFTRAFSALYGISPGEYRKNPRPVAMRTIIRPFDCYLMKNSMLGSSETSGEIKTYFVTVPAHKFLHIRN